MTDKKHPINESFELFGAACDGTLGDEQTRRLEALLLESPEARQTYLAYMQLHADLCWEATSGDALRAGVPVTLELNESDQAFTDSISDEALELALQHFDSIRGWDRGAAGAAPLGRTETLGKIGLRNRFLVAASLVTAVALLVVVGVTFWTRPALDQSVQRPRREAGGRTFVSHEFAATVLSTFNCQWDEGFLPAEPGTQVPAGPLHLRSGIAELSLRDGIQLILEGPVKLDLADRNGVTLESGTLLALVPQWVVGFRVETPVGTLIETGAEFAVQVGPNGSTLVQVLDGAVEVLPPAEGQPGGLQRQRIGHGEVKRAGPGQASWIDAPDAAERFIHVVAILENMRNRDFTWRPLAADDFEDDLLNRELWRTDVSNLPQPGTASVVESEGRLKLSNRGRLITTRQYDPLDEGPLRIRGSWTFESPRDTMHVLTRSDAIPGQQYGLINSGVECMASMTGLDVAGLSGIMLIFAKRDGALVEGAKVISILEINPGDVFNFEIVDDGRNVSFKMTEVGGDGSSAIVNGATPWDFRRDYIVLHNREKTDETHVSYLDNLFIESGTPRSDKLRNPAEAR